MTNLEVGAPMPGSIGLCADEYKRVQQLRLLMEKETDAVKARESEIKNHIIKFLCIIYFAILSVIQLLWQFLICNF